MITYFKTNRAAWMLLSVLIAAALGVQPAQPNTNRSASRVDSTAPGPNTSHTVSFRSEAPDQIGNDGNVASPPDSALSFSSEGFADTDFALSRIDGKPHSITFRFWMRYPNSNYNGIIGESGNGIYTVAKTASRSGGCIDQDPTRISFSAGSSRGDYQRANINGGFAGSKWYNIAIAVDAMRRVKVFVDGASAVMRGGGQQTLPATPPWATGVLRFGQRNNTPSPHEQFYGLLDDVAVWDHPLTEAEVKALVATPKLKGGEKGLMAAWNFDVIAKTAPPAKILNRPLVLHGGSSAVKQTLPAPVVASHVNHVTQLSLPVKDGDWFVAQGADSNCGSHRGYASFCIDIARVEDLEDGIDKTLNNAASITRGQQVVAAADGKVVFIRDSTPDDPKDQAVVNCKPCSGSPVLPAGARDNCDYLVNEVILEHAPNEFTHYVHLKPGSVPADVKKKLVSGKLIQRGEKIGEVGRSGTGAHGNHLHFAFAWAPELPANVGANPGKDTAITTGSKCGYMPAVPNFLSIETRPFQFSNYWVFSENAGDFRKVGLGTPRFHEVIRFQPPPITFSLPPLKHLPLTFRRDPFPERLPHNGRIRRSVPIN
jgi:concanavalin A-like lectin/glucanase superfamily protein/peptidase M23-like protein